MEVINLFFIRKTTAIWLFQEGESVSSDRLFCVRAKQPYSSESIQFEQQSDIQGDAWPIVNPNVKLGEICAFMRDKMWKIRKVLQF